ncbi:MAG TPA: hypothetical protein VFC90_06620 [Planctomycetota bacterium]|nr:hypothetical protein [Planctomycetota bacterium]
MMTLAAAALLVAIVPQDEARLKESWPKLVEAWKGVEEYKPAPDAGPLDDEYLKVVAKMNGAFEAAGVYAAEGEYLPHAVKAFIKCRGRGLSAAGSSDPWNRTVIVRRKLVRMAGAGGAPGGFDSGAPADSDPMGALLASLKKLQTLKDGGLDDEENVQDELSTARKSLKAIGITADNTPPALRRRVLHLIRALALGEGYPEPAVATEEQAKQIRAQIGELAHESIENREKAMKELLRAGEGSLAIVREALKSTDAEVASRARQLLGVGHAPWKNVTPRSDYEGVLEFHVAPAAPAAPAVPAPPKEEKPK